MNKRLKVVLFVLVGIVSFLGLVIGGYFLLRSAYSVTIYNVKIVDENNNPMRDISRNLTSTSDNFIKLNAVVEASDSQQPVYFTSSNPDVAKVIKQDDGYVLKYYNAGTATITAYSPAVPAVRDSFIITVNQNFVDNVVISGAVDNRFTLCADSSSYSFPYNVYGIGDDEENTDNSIYDSMLLRVVDNYDKDVFQRISIDQSSDCIDILTKTVIYDSTQVFYLQAYYVDEEQVEHVVKNFAYYVDVIGKRLVDVQLLVSEDSNFEGKNNVYLSTEPYDKFLYLEYNDVVVNRVVLSERVPNLYFKIRLIYSNNNSVDASEFTNTIPQPNEIPSCLTIGGSAAAGSKYWRIEFNKDEYTSGDVGEIVRTFTLNYQEDIVTGQTSSISKTFSIVYKCAEAEDNSKYQNFINNNLYASVVEKGSEDTHKYYKYIYWDTRYKHLNTKNDKNGNVIGFNDSYLPDPEYKMVIDHSGGFLYYINSSGEYFDKNFQPIDNPND